MQVLVDQLMTAADAKADVLVTSALQSSLAVLGAAAAADFETCEATFEFLQHLLPAQQHLVLLQRHFEVCTAALKPACMLMSQRPHTSDSCLNHHF